MPKTGFFSLYFLFAVTAGAAQYRAGGINAEIIFEKMPAVIRKQLDTVFAAYQDSLHREYGKLEAAANSEAEKFIGCYCCAPLPDSTTQNMQQRIISIIQRVYNFRKYADSLVQKKQADLKAQFFLSFKEQLRPIAFACGYDIVTDLCADKILPIPQCTDITDLVLQKLNW